VIISIAGPSKCGKSELAEEQVINHNVPVTYIATLPNEDIFYERISVHQERRPEHWRLIEVDTTLIRILKDAIAPSPHAILLDGLAVYTGRIIDSFLKKGQPIELIIEEIKRELFVFFEIIRNMKNDLWIVTNTGINKQKSIDMWNAIYQINDLVFSESEHVHYIGIS